MIFPDNGYDLEDANWRDTGCELFPSCLDCPRERVSRGAERKAEIRFFWNG
jgi:hypothetical protein